MQKDYKAKNNAWERVLVSSTCLSIHRCLLSSPAPYSCYVTYHLVLATLLTYTYFLH